MDHLKVNTVLCSSTAVVLYRPRPHAPLFTHPHSPLFTTFFSSVFTVLSRSVVTKALVCPPVVTCRFTVPLLSIARAAVHSSALTSVHSFFPSGFTVLSRSVVTKALVCPVVTRRFTLFSIVALTILSPLYCRSSH